ncbi:sirohydrochlorin chelatase [Ramlibacter montanisoli]|uniref:sirohydrochlorin chelatase n=1 Tax=Ramlibacter montanisoli TaxID=2732512 RepID=UPI0035A0CE94
MRLPELDTPGLPDAAAELVAAGAGQVTIVPMFLGTGRHAREDLPLLVDGLRARFPSVAFVLQKPVGRTAGSSNCSLRLRWNKGCRHNACLS